MYESLLVLCTFALLTPCCFKPVGWLAKLAPCKLIVHVLLEDTSRNGASVNQRSLNSQVRYSVRLTTRLTFMEIHQLVQSRKMFQVV